MSDTTAEQTDKPVVYGSGVPANYDGVAILRIKSAVAKPSKSGNSMVECRIEVLAPEWIESPFDGKRYMLDTAELMAWFLLFDLDKNGKTLQAGLTWLNEVLLPGILQIEGAKFNPEAPLYHEEKNPSGVKLEGLVFEAPIHSEEKMEYRRLPGGEREVLKDYSGNPVKKGWGWKPLDVGTILRRANADGTPF